ncbi:GTP-binding protein Rhes-like [Protopterus annectens]|uniref:GTP-binding protein Rhes-like n=1 Tax=Protopterus annectens TaxID=7888 RepID=UPI001CFC23ED|nr:GTP-binding protein Rhes-like [Protopterus annectens]
MTPKLKTSLMAQAVKLQILKRKLSEVTGLRAGDGGVDQRFRSLSDLLPTLDKNSVIKTIKKARSCSALFQAVNHKVKLVSCPSSETSNLTASPGKCSTLESDTTGTGAQRANSAAPNQHPEESANFPSSFSCSANSACLSDSSKGNSEVTCPGCTQKLKTSKCIRLVVLGSSGVGKSSLVRRLLRGNYEEGYQPTVEDFHRKVYLINGNLYQLDILDMSGSNTFPAKRQLSILTGDVFLLVFSLDSVSSFLEVCSLRKQILEVKSKLGKADESNLVPMVICGNKLDLGYNRAVSQEEVNRILGHGSNFFEVSAKEGMSTEEMFHTLVRKAGLPVETSPALHRNISVNYFHQTRLEAKGKKYIDACGAVFPCAVRPSIDSDLKQIMKHNVGRRKNKLEKCNIQ